MRFVFVIPALVAAIAAGCTPTEPTMVYGRQYERASVGCLDLAMSRSSLYSTHAPVIEYDVLDRCTHRAPVDLSQLRVVTRPADGTQRELAAYDPRHELVPGELVAARSVRVLVAYDSEPPAAPGDPICVDVAGIGGVHAPAPQWHCLGVAP